MTEAVDPKLFRELSAQKEEGIVLPPLCTYDSVEKCYRIRVWGCEYQVYPDEAVIIPGSGIHGGYDFFHVFLINYLLSDKTIKGSGEWISEKDLTGGVTFFRGPHEIPTRLISDKFGNDIQSLQEKCEQLQGFRLSMADCSYGFDVVGAVRLALLYWQGDDDFPPEAKLLLDGSVSGSLKLDVVYALLCDACMRIAGN